MPNRLADATSPYLRQHADNPVDWMPWGDEAFERARREGKPVFLSVGYSSCHWCHVMAHESFEDPEVAARLNEGFVSVKVDREERPDVDEAYMAFVQMATGRGGWPMSVFLTPDRQPFYGGTYWPKDDRGAQPGFLRVLASLSQAWKERREEVETEAARLGAELERYFATGSPESTIPFGPELYAAALGAQVEAFDPERGGFGPAPKFPPHTAIAFLLDLALSDFAADEARQAALAMAFVTLERMVLGGIHDHVGGGFHRYSTDADWLLPHFEKMLYDNALMLGNLARAAAVASEIDPLRANLFARAAGGIVSWLDREMTSPEGLFYSALDADSLDAHGHQEEGAYYVWPYAELPPEIAEAFQARPDGNFRDEATGRPTGTNILHLREDHGDILDADLDALLARRAARPLPGLDDKAIVAWNGLMIGALADAGLAEPAVRAAEAILGSPSSSGSSWRGGWGERPLPHLIVSGQPQGRAYLDDVAALADGLFKLADLLDAERGLESAPGTRASARTGEDWRSLAKGLGQTMIADFEDPATGAYLSTSAAHENLFGRTRSLFDSPTPSGNALALRVLVAMGETARAERLVAAVLGTMERAPTATEALYAAAMPLVGSAGFSPPSDPGLQSGQPTVRLAQKEVRADAEGRATLTVVLELPDGLHANGPNPPDRRLTPTRVTVRPLEAEIAYPTGEYAGTVEIPLAVTLPTGESGADLEIAVAFQPCTDRECHAPVECTLNAVVYR